MKRHNRPAKTPETISLSKNHSIFPLSFPPTKAPEDHVLPDGSTAHGVALYNEDGEVTYVVGSPADEKPMGLFDRNAILVLLASLQIKLRQKKKAGKSTNDFSSYTLSFDSIYGLLKFLKLPTDGKHYARMKESLRKLTEVSLYFTSFHTGKHKKEDTLVIMGMIDSVKSNWDSESKNKLLIRLNKEWVDMNEGFFLMYDLPTLLGLSESAFNLVVMLEPWKTPIFQKDYVLKRKFGYVCDRLGLNQKRPKKDLNKAIKQAMSRVNAACGTEYSITFKDGLVLFGYKDIFIEND